MHYILYLYVHVSLVPAPWLFIFTDTKVQKFKQQPGQLFLTDSITEKILHLTVYRNPMLLFHSDLRIEHRINHPVPAVHPCANILIFFPQIR